jgi:hypothetical protein
MGTSTMKRTVPFTIVLVGVLAAALVVFAPKAAYAGDIATSGGAKYYGIENGKVCKKVDLTGNKKKDKVKYTFKSKKLTVYVNGKKSLTFSKAKYCNYVSVFKLKNGKAFLAVSLVNKKGLLDGGVYQYKSGKLKKVIDFAALTKSQKSAKSTFGGLASIDKNTVHVYCEAKQGKSYLRISRDYAYKSKTLKPVKKSLQVSRW